MKIVILGGGPAGYKAALAADKAGMDVVLIEKEALGGTCLNWGCIPTKAYYKSALVGKLLKESEEYGFHLPSMTTDWSMIQDRKNRIVGELSDGLKRTFKGTKIKVISGSGHFIDPRKIQVDTHEGAQIIEGELFIIATGSTTKMLPIPGLAEYAITPKSLMQMSHLPREMVIIGGGVIGMEFASIFANLGVKITVIEAMNTILSKLDQGTIKRSRMIFKKQGIQIITEAKVLSIIKSLDRVTVTYQDKDGIHSIECDQTLNAVGRAPRVAGMGFEKINLNFDHLGIKVDGNFKTNLPHIYAIGDVTGENMLAHYAYYAAHEVIEHMQGKETVKNPIIPSCVFTLPEIGEVGYNEESAKAAGISVKVYKNLYGSNGKALALGEREGLVKLLADENDYLIGATIMGAEASVLIHECGLAIQNKLTCSQIKHTIHAHPTLSELIVDCLD